MSSKLVINISMSREQSRVCLCCFEYEKHMHLLLVLPTKMLQVSKYSKYEAGLGAAKSD